MYDLMKAFFDLPKQFRITAARGKAIKKERRNA